MCCHMLYMKVNGGKDGQWKDVQKLYQSEFLSNDYKCQWM